MSSDNTLQEFSGGPRDSLVSNAYLSDHLFSLVVMCQRVTTGEMLLNPLAPSRLCHLDDLFNCAANHHYQSSTT